MIDNIIKQINPKLVPVIFLAGIALGLLASYLYVFKKPWTTFNTWQTTLEQLRTEQENSPPLQSNIAQLELQIDSLEKELYGSGPDLPANQLVAHIIKELDQIADRHGVKLGGVKPGNKKSILMFDEMPFHIEITGNYSDLYNWLQEVETTLGPMVVKDFEIQVAAIDKQKRDMRLTIASYRQNRDLL